MGLSGWTIYSMLGCSITVWVCPGGLILIACMFYNSVGLSGWPNFTLLGCSITV